MIDILSAYGKDTPANPPIQPYRGSADGLVLQIPRVLDVLKRANPTDDTQTVYVTLDDDCIVMETEKQNINLVFSLDEMRAIMRLFDHEGEE